MLLLTKVLLGSGLSTGLAGPSASEVGFPVTGSPTLLSRSPGPRPEAVLLLSLGPAPRHAFKGQLRTSVSLALSVGPSEE